MSRNNILTVGALVLAIIGIYLVYLGQKAGIQPPIISGVGFIVIAFVFLGLRTKG